jgi:hypothetical protein
MDLGKSAIVKQRYVKHTIAGDTCIKSHVYHYTIPYEMVICDRQLHTTLIGAVLISSVNCFSLFCCFELYRFVIIKKKNLYWFLEF